MADVPPSANGGPVAPIGPALGDDGQRDAATGRFVKGNKGGPGNPFAKYAGEVAKRAQALKLAMLAAVDLKDVQEIMAALVAAARRGNITAAREVFDRTVGKATEDAEVLQRIAELERIIAGGGDEP